MPLVVSLIEGIRSATGGLGLHDRTEVGGAGAWLSCLVGRRCVADGAAGPEWRAADLRTARRRAAAAGRVPRET